jgi:hypothetical protein
MYLIHITHMTLIKDVQKEFNALYPSLWIDFYADGGSRENLLLPGRKVNPDRPLKEPAAPGGLMDTDIDIDKERTVAQLKSEFQKNFGLRVKIMRKSGSLWVGVSLTDSWTLERQNAAGAEIRWKGTTGWV